MACDHLDPVQENWESRPQNLTHGKMAICCSLKNENMPVTPIQRIVRKRTPESRNSKNSQRCL